MGGGQGQCRLAVAPGSRDIFETDSAVRVKAPTGEVGDFMSCHMGKVFAIGRARWQKSHKIEFWKITLPAGSVY
jgi:hypothetical protein